MTIPPINIVIGDLHFGRYSNDLKELEISIQYFKNFIFPMLKELNEKFGKENIGVIQIGDIYDNRSLISTEIQDSILDIFEEMAEENLVIADTGNHDKFNQLITTSRIISYIKQTYKIYNSKRKNNFYDSSYGNQRKIFGSYIKR